MHSLCVHAYVRVSVSMSHRHMPSISSCVFAAGAVLVTADGQWPADDQQPQLIKALQQCGIKIWELYKVDNSSSAAAPLTVPEGPMKTVESVI